MQNPPERRTTRPDNNETRAPADRGNRSADSLPILPPIAAAPPPVVALEARPERVPSSEPTATPPPPPPVARIARAEDEVRTTLARYQSAYERLDAGAAKEVWPSVNEAALARAFENLESQDLSLSDCRLAVTGNRAQAWCKGTARYVRRVGNKAAQQDQRQWTFTLSKDANAWRIDSVQTR